MDFILSAEKRDVNASKAKLRKQGYVLASVYSKSMGSSPIQIEAASLKKCLKQGASKVHLKIGNEKIMASIEEVQKNSIGTEFIHVSFHAFSANEKVTITVPIHLEGKPVGTTTGGVLAQQLATVDLYGLPGDIPDYLAVDVSNLELGHSIHIGELPKGKFEIKDAADKVIAACNYPKLQSLEPDTTETEPAVAGEEQQQTTASSESSDTEKAA